MIPLSNTIVQLTVTKETKDIAMPFRKGETQLSSGSAFFIEKKNNLGSISRFDLHLPRV